MSEYYLHPSAANSAEAGYQDALATGKCPACGQKKRKPRTEGTKDATPKERSRVRIDIPVAERAHGYDDFMEMLGEAREKLPLGYDADTPNWYVLFAVLCDWLDNESRRPTRLMRFSTRLDK
jgi:hypothetical protein